MDTYLNLSDDQEKQSAIILADNDLDTSYGKVTHGLLRLSSRFNVSAIVAPDVPYDTSGTIIPDVHHEIPIFDDLTTALAILEVTPKYAIIGIANSGGRMSEVLRGLALDCIEQGINVVNGLHDYLTDDPELSRLSQNRGATLLDLRKPKPANNLHFWSGAVYGVKVPKVAVLGTDCVLGKRTTAWMLVKSLKRRGVKAELIYTGQTAWLQGAEHGFILDATLNDFVSGELERSIVDCDRKKSPDLMLIEGQSSLRNPSGPCGAELLLSANATAAIIQHSPRRLSFLGVDNDLAPRPDLDAELKILDAYNVPCLGVALNTTNMSTDEITLEMERIRKSYSLPVCSPLNDGCSPLMAVIEALVSKPSYMAMEDGASK